MKKTSNFYVIYFTKCGSGLRRKRRARDEESKKEERRSEANRRESQEVIMICYCVCMPYSYEFYKQLVS